MQELEKIIVHAVDGRKFEYSWNFHDVKVLEGMINIIKMGEGEYENRLTIPIDKVLYIEYI